MSIELEGLNEVLKSLENIASIDDFETALGMACARVERTAKENASKFRGTGELGRSITSRIEKNGEVIEGIVFTPLEYAPYVEYGTGIFARDSDGNATGRQEVPWVYVEGGGGRKSTKKTIHTEQSAKEAVAYLRSKGLNAKMTYGQEAQPFLRPALYANREEILRILGGTK
jgi:HK97 gp10 family phage protein